LAEAAGDLLCNSTNQKVIERERQSAVRKLLLGSSYMPKYVPSNSADISAKGLLDEYSQVLSEAIESRTKITDLWKVMETTEIGYEVFYDEEALEKELSTYGEAAIFPPQLLFELSEYITSGQFIAGGYDDWAYPQIHLGYISTRIRIRIFCIPEEQRSLFDDDFSMVYALTFLGFDIAGESFPNYDLNDHVDGAGWKEVNASIISVRGFNLPVQHAG